MNNEQPIVVILSPETILDVFLEHGNMPEEAYEALNKLMSIEEKSVLAELTHIGLESLNDKMPLEDALKAIFATILNLK